MQVNKKKAPYDSSIGGHRFSVPRMAEHAIAASAMIPVKKNVKFIALTKMAGLAGVGVAEGSPL